MASAVGFSSDFKSVIVRSCFDSVSSSYSPSICVYRSSDCLIRRFRRRCGLNLRFEVTPHSSSLVEKIGSVSFDSLSTEKRKISAFDRYTKGRSTILVIGVSFHNAPLEIRERLAIQDGQCPQLISELCALNHVEEAAILSTCNRTEVYIAALAKTPAIKEVTDWMSQMSGVPATTISEFRFLLEKNEATQHLFQVASGLDSLVLGEAQILGQVKQVVRSGESVPGFGRTISSLFKRAIHAGKRVRAETSIGSGAISVSSAAVELALTKLRVPADRSRVLVVGAGKMGRLVVKHLVSKGCTRMTVVNRTLEKVDRLRSELGPTIALDYSPPEEMMARAQDAEAVFVCTNSDKYIFEKADVAEMRQTRDGAHLFVDISVPRNVDPGVAGVEGCTVYNVDDLEEVAAGNREERGRRAAEAAVIITEEVKEFEAWVDTLATVPTKKKLKEYAERVRCMLLEKCVAEMGDGVSERQLRAVTEMSVGLANKLMQGPMHRLRCSREDTAASRDEIFEDMDSLNRIFKLGVEEELERIVKEKMEKVMRG